MDDQGNRIAESRHYPYGGERWRWPAGGAFPTEYRFTGQRLDSYINMYIMGVRWYDAALGRWTSPDSIVPEPWNPQSLNRYTYVSGHPLSATDPSGHIEVNEGDAYQESYSEEYWYCYLNPASPGCQTNWEQVRDAGLLLLATAAAPTLVGAGARYIAQIGWKVMAARLLKATGEELAESAVTGRDPDPINIGLDAAFEVLDEARVAAQQSSSMQPDDYIMQFQGNKPEAGVDPIFNNRPRGGESALSGQLGSNPIQGIRNAFSRDPVPGEFYRVATVKQLCVNGAYPVYDAGKLGMPAGHVSMYTHDPVRFSKAWSRPLPVIQ